jgi:hypothetical protein
VASCGSSGGGSSDPPPLTGWAAIRAATVLQVALPSEFGTPRPQALACDGWEDGIFISRDGRHLFAIYVPADLLSFTIDGADQDLASSYRRGPAFGMDLATNPLGKTMWLHGDILHATRAGPGAPFSAWSLSAMARPVWSEGAVVAQGPTCGPWDLFVYTSNETGPDYKPHIYLLRNAVLDPAGGGTVLPAPVTTSTAEDNPHLERISAADLVLFFDSDDRAGGLGAHDLWYATSSDDGGSWTTPALSALSTAADEQQPHLFQDALGAWWAYFTATNPVDGKLGIFRVRQTTAGNWNAWGARELVLGAGNAEAVGEPTLTSAGDLSLVVVTKDPNGASTDRYDADPWILPHIPTSLVLAHPARAPLAAIGAP